MEPVSFFCIYTTFIHILWYFYYGNLASKNRLYQRLKKQLKHNVRASRDHEDSSLEVIIKPNKDVNNVI